MRALEPLSERLRREVLPRLSFAQVYGGDAIRWGRAGQWRTRPCPLHGGRNPSFHVHPETLAWRCWSKCGESGDAVDFTMRSHGLGFIGAVHHLAELAGLLWERESRTPVRASPSTQRQRHSPRRPPAHEAAALWATALPVTNVAEAVAYLESRELDPARIEELDLARVLALGVNLPACATHWRRAGEDFFRLLCPVYGAGGRLESLRARPLRQRTEAEGRKALPLMGDNGGLIMADALVRLVLSGAALGDGSSAAAELQRVGLAVMEGEPDFLDQASAFSDANEGATAVIGIVSGAWSTEIADRIPPCTAYLCTHLDPAGDAYANAIGRDLKRRGCSLYRLKAAPSRRMSNA